MSYTRATHIDKAKFDKEVFRPFLLMFKKRYLSTHKEIHNLLMQYSQKGDDLDKAWVIDQIARLFWEDRYHANVRAYCNGEDGPDTYEWSQGIPP
jgi:hypothetical protein